MLCIKQMVKYKLKDLTQTELNSRSVTVHFGYRLEEKGDLVRGSDLLRMPNTDSDEIVHFSY